MKATADPSDLVFATYLGSVLTRKEEGRSPRPNSAVASVPASAAATAPVSVSDTKQGDKHAAQ